MSSRDAILTTIRRHLPQAAPLPDLNQVWTTYSDAASQFAAVLTSVGGRCLKAADAAAANAALAGIPEYQTAAKRCSLVPGIGSTTFDLAAVDDPHALADVDFAILPGQLAVAENAAVWVTDENLRHRVLYFLPQHLALVVPASRIVHHLHEAYAQIEVGRHPFAGFIAGPSKTADIEQSLVVGAHGARSLTVFLIGG